MFPLLKTPLTVKVRLLERDGLFYVIQRDGDGWESIFHSKDRGKALDFLKVKLEERPNQWALEVKMRDGWCCTDCGELDRSLLEAHHTKPKHIFPELADDIENGETKCIYCHAQKHKDEPAIYNMILARLAIILYKRFY